MIYLTSENGKLYKHKLFSDELETVFEHDDYLMGIVRCGDELLLGSRKQIFSTKGRKSEPIKYKTDFHHMTIRHSTLLVASTSTNSIYYFDHTNNLKQYCSQIIAPPLKAAVRYKHNYNHINKIFYDENQDKFYISLNWLTSKQYGPSGVAVMDGTLHEIERFEYGWESHGFFIYEDVKYALCATSGNDKKINHPPKSGLLANGKLVFEHDYKKFFCKDLSINDKYIAIVGGDISMREDRRYSDGVLFILDRDYKLLEKKVFPKSGGFKGCLFEGLDFSVNSK